MSEIDEEQQRCYCGGPEEQVYGHVFGTGRHCWASKALGEPAWTTRGSSGVSEDTQHG